MKTKKQKIANGILVAVMLVLSLFFLFPVIWMIANSFRQCIYSARTGKGIFR